MRRPPRARAALLTAGSVFLAALVGACGSPSGAPPSAAELLPESSALVGERAGPPADDPPAELLVERASTRQADELLNKTLQMSDFCEVAFQLDAGEEPEPYDLEELETHAAIIVQAARSLDPESKVRNPDDFDEEIDLPEEMADLVATVRREMYAYMVRVAYVKALHDRQLVSEDEVRRRLDRAFVQLYHSDYTAADREIVALRPRYCS